MRSVAYSKSALKVLSRMPANLSKRITGKVEQYAADPRSQANNVKALGRVDTYLVQMTMAARVMTAK